MSTEENKALVQQAMAALIETGDAGAIAQFLSDDFVHHRPGGVSATKAEWLTAVRTAMVPLAAMQVEIEQVLADGDHVVVRSRRWLPGGPEISVVEIWRIDDGLVAEGWETIEATSRVAANQMWWEGV